MLLNVSASEDSLQEFAVVRGGRVIDSLTVEWFETDEALRQAILSLAIADGGGDAVGMDPELVENQIPCRLCA